MGESFPVYPKHTRLRDTGRGKYDTAMDVLGDYGLRTTWEPTKIRSFLRTIYSLVLFIWEERNFLVKIRGLNLPISRVSATD